MVGLHGTVALEVGLGGQGLVARERVFAIDPPLAAPETLWRRICAAVPDLTTLRAEIVPR